MKNNLVLGVVGVAVAVIFLPITKIVIGAGICSAAYYGYKKLSK